MAHKIKRAGTFDVRPRAEIHMPGYVIESADGLSRVETGSEGPHFEVVPEDGETLDEAVSRFMDTEHWDGLTLAQIRDAAPKQ